MVVNVVRDFSKKTVFHHTTSFTTPHVVEEDNEKDELYNVLLIVLSF